MFKKIISTITLSALLASCAGSTARKDVTAVGQSFAACAKTDVGKAVDSGGTAIAAVIGIVTAGLANWQAELDQLAITVGDDALSCAIAAVEAVLGAAKPGAGSGSSAPAMKSAVPSLAGALERAHEYEGVLAARAALGKSIQAK